jgi:hypothetical protein
VVEVALLTYFELVFIILGEKKKLFVIDLPSLPFDGEGDT